MIDLVYFSLDQCRDVVLPNVEAGVADDVLEDAAGEGLFFLAGGRLVEFKGQSPLFDDADGSLGGEIKPLVDTEFEKLIGGATNGGGDVSGDDENACKEDRV